MIQLAKDSYDTAYAVIFLGSSALPRFAKVVCIVFTPVFMVLGALDWAVRSIRERK